MIGMYGRKSADLKVQAFISSEEENSKWGNNLAALTQRGG